MTRCLRSDISSQWTITVRSSITRGKEIWPLYIWYKSSCLIIRISFVYARLRILPALFRKLFCNVSEIVRWRLFELAAYVLQAVWYKYCVKGFGRALKVANVDPAARLGKTSGNGNKSDRKTGHVLPSTVLHVWLAISRQSQKPLDCISTKLLYQRQ